MHCQFMIFNVVSGLSAVDFFTVMVLLCGVGLLLLLSHGKRFRLFRKVFGPSRTRLTLEGKLFLGLSGVICAAAINTHVSLMYLVAGLTLSALIVSVAFSRSVQRIQVSRSVPGRVHAGEQVTVRLSLKSVRRRVTTFTVVAEDNVEGPAAVKLPTVSAVQLRAASTRYLSYRCMFPRRGIYRFTHVVLSSRFPFGLFEMQFELPLEHEVVVYPAMGIIRRLPAAHASQLGQVMVRVPSAGQDEFSHLRDFRPDDNPRRIHWRTSARLGKLHVMEFRGLPARTAQIVFDPVVPDDSDAVASDFEKATRVAATICDHLALRDYSLSFSLDETPPIAGPGRRILSEILESLARVQPKVSYDRAEPPGNGMRGLRVSVVTRGRCSFNDRHVVAAACDPELSRWFVDSEVGV